MKHYSIYDVGTGVLKQLGSCPEFAVSAQIPTDPALALIELPEHSWDYWVDVTTDPHTLNAKTAYPYTINKTNMLADGVDTCTILGLHNPTTVTWPDGEVTTETGGEISFRIDLAGEYNVKLQAIPFFDEVIDVIATDPD